MIIYVNACSLFLITKKRLPIFMHNKTLGSYVFVQNLFMMRGENDRIEDSCLPSLLLGLCPMKKMERVLSKQLKLFLFLLSLFPLCLSLLFFPSLFPKDTYIVVV